MSGSTGTTADPDAGNAAAVSEVEEQLGGLLRTVRENAKRSAADVHPELSPFGYKMLWQLRASGACNAGALASVLGVDRSFISRQTRQLEEWGLLEVGADSADGRARVLRLTPLAEEALAASAEHGRFALQRTLESWSVKDLRAFAEYLDRLQRSVGQVAPSPN